MAKVLMKGNEAVAKAAMEAGCKFFFGYPITPQTEIPEYLSRELPKAGGQFVQAESEIAAINMVYGAAAAGARCMTSSSSPGVALKQEGIGYIAKAQLPAVIVNMMRGGPGLGGIQPAQGDYNMCVRGGANGDYHCIVLAPGNLQEAVDMVMEAFDLADYYRNPVYILADGLIGQMMEPVEFQAPPKRDLPPKDWALTGRGNGKKHVITNVNLDAEGLEEENYALFEKYARIEKEMKRCEEYYMEDAEVAFASYGTASRIVRSAVNELRAEGYKVGMIRPKTLWPFPDTTFEKYPRIRRFIDVELSMGQMVPDVQLAVGDPSKVTFFGRPGGVFFSIEEVKDAAKKALGGV